MATRKFFAATAGIACLAFAAGRACAADGRPVEETWTAKFQTTYIWQAKPGFSAAYSGANSLSAARERSYSFTAGVFLGFRPWQGGEVYLNPEATEGLPLSRLTGLGGFSNGEITRVSGRNPIVYRQRLFLRQTWNLGGGEQEVASDFNQMAGTVDRNRFVLTAGNFSTLDVFDRNIYAGDPRRQFINWAHMTYAAFDYAADARGYGWGFAGEWYRGDWVLRFGRMTPPREPNQLPLDYRFLRHYGDQVEVERAHLLGGQPGKVRLLAWHDRAVMARFRDAIAYGAAHGQTPDIFKVRYTEQNKYGLGASVEQAVGDNLGVFFRGMKADGRTETLAFTEVDASLAGGLSLKGAAWGRPQDTVGLAAMRNTLSRDRRQYLQAGGISFFIGDGALRYRPELEFEGYYSWRVAKGLWLTADLQRVYNPAYNADRGPVNFYSIRLHAEL